MTRIFIENYELDLTQGLSNQITYAIDDLNNLDSKSTSFTKTIVLPGTDNNNKLLGNIFEFNSSNFYNPSADNVLYNYNASVSASARIEVNGLQIMKGVLRLIEIVKNGEAIEYEVALFGELGGFINTLGNKRIEDLDFSAYNHTYNVTNITNSWSNTGGSGYCYPLIDYGNVSTGQYGAAKKDFQYNTFKPALYVKEYIDKIFAGSGYTYESAFFNTPEFKRLIVPNNQAILSSTSNIQLAGSPKVKTYSGNSTSLNIELETTTLGNFTLTSNYMLSYLGTTKTVNLNFKFKGNWTIGANATFYCKKNGTPIATYIVGPGNPMHYFDVVFNLTDVTLNNGDVIVFNMEWSGVNAYNLEALSGGSLEIITDIATSVPLNYNEALKMNYTIPRGIFQKDFFISLLKMFNLLVTEDKYKTNHLIISPYIDFWDGSTLDWSEKLDRDQVIKIKPMSEVNARYYNLKYKQDNDYYNEEYRKKYSEGYGDMVYDNGLEFVKDTEAVEVIFSSSVLYGTTGTDKVFPAIYKKSNGNTKEDPMDHNVRIMQVNLITDVASWNILSLDTVLASKTSYMYAGHLDDPDAPSYDINFGAPKQLYFTIATGDLSNNLFNTYYSPYLAEITDKDSRLLSGSFKLTDNDIFNLSFSKYIFIDGGVYRLSKIIDFSPEANDLTKVELLRVIEKSASTHDTTPNFKSQNFNTCNTCDTYLVYRDVNPYSATFNNYRVNGINVGNTAPTSGSCNLAANWESQAYYNCYNCVNALVYKDTNVCSPTYNHYRLNGVDVGTTVPESSMCNYTANWVSQAYSTCVNCNTYLVYKDTTPCSPTYNHYRVNGTDVGTVAPSNGACITSANLTIQNYTTCYNCNVYDVYKDTNTCSATYLHYFVNNVDVGTTAPTGGVCDYSKHLVSQAYNTCVACNNYLVYKDTNPCSATYLHYFVAGVSVGTTAPTSGNCVTTKTLTNQNYSVCFGCTSYRVYRDTNACSPTYLHYFVNGEDQGTTAPTESACDTSANWTSQGYNTCISCTNYLVYKDLNICSSTYGHYRVNGNDVGTTAPTAGDCNVAPILTSQGYDTCIRCTNYLVYKDTNPCSSTLNHYYVNGADLGTTAPVSGSCNTSANWVDTGYTYCSNCVSYKRQIDQGTCSETKGQTRNVPGGSACDFSARYDIAFGLLYYCENGSIKSYTVYKNSNNCFTGNQYLANGVTYGTNPSNTTPDSTPNWQPNGSNFCIGLDLYQPQIDVNQCSAGYNSTRNYLIQANSSTCAEQYVMSSCAGGGTVYSIVYTIGSFSVGDTVYSNGVYYLITSIIPPTSGGIVITATGLSGCPQSFTLVRGCQDSVYYTISDTHYYTGTITIDSNYYGGTQCAQVMGTETTPGHPIAGVVSDSWCACD